MSAFQPQKVLSVHHWTDRLFSFRTTRDPSFRFENGQFVMIGLEQNGRPLVRAYSIASANYEEDLEFLSIKVPDGPLTSKLRDIVPGDEILIGRKPTGTLLLTNLTPARNLYLMGTGTGLAPFMSIIKDPETYDRFDKVVLLHGCREVAELAYGDEIREELPKHELIGDLVREKLVYVPTVTREPFQTRGRIPDLIKSGELETLTGLPALNPENDRAMLCGSPQMIADLTSLLEERGFNEGSSSSPAEYVVEKAFVEK